MSRSTGRTAVGIVAYATGQRMKDNETGKWCKRNHPGDVLEWGTTIPPNAQAWLADRDKLSDAWNASTAAEKRKDSELAKHWNIALPRQSTPEQQGELMRDMAQKITDRYGVMVTWAVHEAPEHGDERNAHGHLVLGTRTIDENGFGPKAAGLNGPKRKTELVWQREMFADTINRYLEGQGIDERVSAKSYKDRGIDQEPTIHMGNAVNQAELNGERTGIGDENRARKARNAERDNIDKTMAYLKEMGTRGVPDEELRRIQGLIDDLNSTDAGDRHPLIWSDGAGMVQQQQAANRAFRRSAALPHAPTRSVASTANPPSQPLTAYDPMRDFVTDATKKEVADEMASRANDTSRSRERGGQSR